RAAAAAREQDRLVAHLGRIGGDARLPRRPALGGRAPAVAARYDAWIPLVLAQQFGDAQYERRLAAAAGDEIADHNHRDPGLVAFEYVQFVKKTPEENRN